MGGDNPAYRSNPSKTCYPRRMPQIPPARGNVKDRSDGVYEKAPQEGSDPKGTRSTKPTSKRTTAAKGDGQDKHDVSGAYPKSAIDGAYKRISTIATSKDLKNSDI